MSTLSFDERLRRAELVLTKVAEGHLDQRIEMSDEEDALAGLEMGINFLIVDLRQTEQANREPGTAERPMRSGRPASAFPAHPIRDVRQFPAAC